MVPFHVLDQGRLHSDALNSIVLCQVFEGGVEGGVDLLVVGELADGGLAVVVLVNLAYFEGDAAQLHVGVRDLNVELVQLVQILFEPISSDRAQVWGYLRFAGISCLCISSTAMLKSRAFELILENTVPSIFGKELAKTLLGPMVVIFPGFSLIPLMFVSFASRESRIFEN